MSLVDYDDSEEELENDPVLPEKLPLPSAITNMFNSECYEEHHIDCFGKIRSFPHERGVWASFLYAPYMKSEPMKQFIQDLLIICHEHNFNLNENDELHLSLTKTLKLRHHWIEDLVDTFRSKLKNFNTFRVMFESISIYTNEEKTRTFIGLTISRGSHVLKEILKKVDQSVAEFRLPKFYSSPSFHISVAWIVGDHQQALEDISLQTNSLFQRYSSKYRDFNRIEIKEIVFKTGNQLHLFALDCD